MYRIDLDMIKLMNILDIEILGPYDKYKVERGGTITIDRGANCIFGRIVRTFHHHCGEYGYCKKDLIIAMSKIVQDVVHFSSRLHKSYGYFIDIYTSMRKLLRKSVTHLKSVVISIQRSYVYTIVESEYWIDELNNVLRTI